MDTNTLTMFISVVKKGNITAAAKELGYAQSNLSTKIHQLEDDLNTQLLYRNNHGITLTDSGTKFYQQALKIVDLTDETINEIKNPENISGALKIGTLQTAAASYLPIILAQYHQKNPNVELSIQTGTTLQSGKSVFDYQLDGAIIAGKYSDLNLKSIQLTSEILKLAVPMYSPNDFKKLPLLVFPSGCAYRKTLESYLDFSKYEIHQTIEFNNLNAIIASVSSGLGISVLPENLITEFAQKKAVKLIDLPEEFSTQPISFIYRKDHIKTQAFDNFTNLLKNYHFAK